MFVRSTVNASPLGHSCSNNNVIVSPKSHTVPKNIMFGDKVWEFAFWCVAVLEGWMIKA